MAKQAIMVAIDSFYDGGAEMNAIRTANALSSYYQVHFFELFVDKSTEKKQQPLLAEEIHILQIEKTKGFKTILRFLMLRWVKKVLSAKKRNAIKDFAKQRVMANYLAKHKIEVVNTHAPWCNVFFAHVKHRQKFKLITTLHGHYELMRKKWKTKNRSFNKFVHTHIQAVDRWVYTTKDQLNTLTSFEISPEKQINIYYGLDLPSMAPKPNLKDCLNLILVSRAIPEKGWLQAIQAVLELEPDVLEVTLTMVGDGPYLSELEQKYKDQPRIRFVGHQENISSWLQQAHVGLLPTYYEAESFPNTIIEYLSHGLPVIASAIGAIPEMMATANGHAGTLIDAKRGKPVSKAKLKEAILKLAELPDFNALSKRALEAANKFAMPEVIEAYQRIF